VARLRQGRPYQTWRGSHPPLRSVVPLGCGVGQVNFESIGPYNFGCMAASDSPFDSRGWVFGVKLSDDDIGLAVIAGLRDVAMATI